MHQDSHPSHNPEMNTAWQFIANTGVSVFLTGKAGTGKTTFLRRLVDLMPKRMVVLAPTGVAAINAGGQTIHSFFQLAFGPWFPGIDRKEASKPYKMSESKKNLIRSLDLLVIDEVSMVRADLLDQIDDMLRKLKDWRRPFGGVQLLLIGDLMQLSPVASDEEWRILAPHYDTPYFFSSRALRDLPYVTIELKHIYRQQDQSFIDILAQVRDGNVSAQVIDALNSRYIPNFMPSEDGWIRLTTHNHTARQYNDYFLNRIHERQVVFAAEIDGEFPELSYPADQNLSLKLGAQVMFVKNDPSPAHAYYNGKIGRIVAMSAEGISVKCVGDDEPIKVQPVVWENTKYSLDPVSKAITEKVVGTFKQYPLRLAWAITVHKSQGLTFDHAVLDINDSFAHGQVYVALSRCRTLEGMVLSAPVNFRSVITDSTVNAYISDQDLRAKDAVAALPKYRQEYVVTLLDQLFSFTDISDRLEHFFSVVVEHVSGNYPNLHHTIRTASAALNAEVISVASRFSAQYRNIIAQFDGKISGTPLEKRIYDASAYFAERLDAILPPVIKGAAININNQRVAQIFNNAFSALRDAVVTHRALLETFKSEPFSVSAYLDKKAKLMLDSAMRPAATRTRQKSQKAETPQKAEKPKKEKKPKGSTALESLALFQQGLTVEDIAKKRGLQTSTIFGHLATFVPSGKVDVNRLVSADHQKAIRKAIASFSSAFTYSDIRPLLPEDISYGEIRVIIDLDRPS